MPLKRPAARGMAMSLMTEGFMKLKWACPLCTRKRIYTFLQESVNVFYNIKILIL